MSDIMEGVSRRFLTGVALITTHSSFGPNVMSAEWTMQVSYRPMLIAVFIHPEEASHQAILESKEFGVNVCADDQSMLCHIAGSFSRHDVDKLSSKLFSTYAAKYIRAPLIKGAVVNAECRLVASHQVGDHTGFIGEVIAARFNPAKKAIALHARAYRKLTSPIQRKPFVYVLATRRDTPEGVNVSLVGRHRTLRKNTRVRLIAYSEKGTQVFADDARTDSEGYFSSLWIVSSQTPKGVYKIEATTGKLKAYATAQI